MQISLIQKSVFGRDLIYPACEQSEKLAAFKGSKTFTVEDLKQLKEIGFEMQFIAEVPEFLQSV